MSDNPIRDRDENEMVLILNSLHENQVTKSVRDIAVRLIRDEHLDTRVVLATTMIVSRLPQPEGRDPERQFLGIYRHQLERVIL